MRVPPTFVLSGIGGTFAEAKIAKKNRVCPSEIESWLKLSTGEGGEDPSVFGDKEKLSHLRRGKPPMIGGNLARPISPKRGRHVKSKISPARLKCRSVNCPVIGSFEKRSSIDEQVSC